MKTSGEKLHNLLPIGFGEHARSAGVVIGLSVAALALAHYIGRKRKEIHARNRYESAFNYERGAKQQKESVSPRLEQDPNHELQLGEELEWFAKRLEDDRGGDYTGKIRVVIDATPELSNLPPDIRTLTTIPVAAASEGDNIFNTLSLYAQQDPENIQRNAILLNVNWLDVARQDPVKERGIDKTFAEIERAKEAFPDLTIAVVTNEYNASEVEKTGGVIGYVASDLMNTALLALHKRVASGDIDPSSDIAIIRQDADMRGMSRHYLRSLEKGMDQHPGTDILNGTIRSDVRTYERFPGFGIVSNFNQALQKVRAGADHPWTVGINIVARAASLAAAGGLGSRLDWTGPGSDDLAVGWRIEQARGRASSDDVHHARTSGYETRRDTASKGGRRILANIPGMTVDSAADRLLPPYLKGRHYITAWDSSASGGTSFVDGPGGYRDRMTDAAVVEEAAYEVAEEGLYRRIEENFSGELRNSDEMSARKALAILFSSVPGAFRIDGAIGDDSVRFVLTPSGREFIKKRVELSGGYGVRSKQQLYDKKGAPLVSPLGQSV